MSIRITVDATLGCAYIELSKTDVARTIEFSEEILIDVDKFGVAVGIELLDEGTVLPFEELVDRFHVHSDVVELLRLIRPDVKSFLDMTTGTDGVSQSVPDRTFSWA